MTEFPSLRRVLSGVFSVVCNQNSLYFEVQPRLPNSATFENDSKCVWPLKKTTNVLALAATGQIWWFN